MEWWRIVALEEVLADTVEQAGENRDTCLRAVVAGNLALIRGGKADRRIADIERRLTILENVGWMK